MQFGPGEKDHQIWFLVRANLAAFQWLCSRENSSPQQTRKYRTTPSQLQHTYSSAMFCESRGARICNRYSCNLRHISHYAFLTMKFKFIVAALSVLSLLTVTEAFTTNSISFSTYDSSRYFPGAALSSTSLQASSEKTLYEILNSSPTASRIDIKREYVKLVKQSHPDALRNNTTEDTEKQFQLTTQAWKTLSNPLERKRYDRELRAQKFTDDVESMVGNVANSAGPQFMKAFENVAMPFLRRGAATTVAGFTAVSQDVKNYSTKRNEIIAVDLKQDAKDGSIGIGAILSNAVVASQKAGKAIDILELIEKSNELRKRARKELQDANALRDELDTVMRKRVQLTIHTPNAKLTSLEAMIILDGFNTLDEVTVLDTLLRLRKTVTYEIEHLQQFEGELKETQEKNLRVNSDLERKTIALVNAKANAAAALQAEVRARKALEDATMLVQSTKGDVLSAEHTLNSLAEDKKQALVDIERLNIAIDKQQEKTRLALRRKEQAIQNDLGIRGDFGQEMAVSAEEEVKTLLKQEANLRAESDRLQATAERIESRSQKLVERANELEVEEENAYKALEQGIRAAKRAADGGYGKFKFS